MLLLGLNMVLCGRAKVGSGPTGRRVDSVAGDGRGSHTLRVGTTHLAGVHTAARGGWNARDRHYQSYSARHRTRRARTPRAASLAVSHGEGPERARLRGGCTAPAEGLCFGQFAFGEALESTLAPGVQRALVTDTCAVSLRSKKPCAKGGLRSPSSGIRHRWRAVSHTSASRHTVLWLTPDLQISELDFSLTLSQLSY